VSESDRDVDGGAGSAVQRSAAQTFSEELSPQDLQKCMNVSEV